MNNKPDQQIIDFIQNHHVLTLATNSKNDGPWCANCLYIYLEEMNLFVFTSDEDTRHVQDIEKDEKVAGSVVLETDVIGRIRGIQFQGMVSRLQDAPLKKAKRAYLKRFPMAALMKTTLWGLEPFLIKMTDNRLGFGKKLIWRASGD
ncbi:MAG: pyridoxamine 5'-phosphate oxidase family protein [Bacteroidota bacterium]